MDDLGAPISYAVLQADTPVFSSDGARIGTVKHVLAAEAEDIFDGIVIGDLDHSVIDGRGHRFVDAPEIDAIHEHGVTLTIDRAGCRSLPEPTANPGEIDADPTAAPPSALGDKLRRAWDLLSGNY
jgi:hypothetical protein